MPNNNKPTLPPKLAQRLLNWFLKPDLAEEVMGDLEEKYLTKLALSEDEGAKQNKTKANWNYWFQTINYLRPFAIRNDLLTQLNPFFMIRHNLKITLRKFRRNKTSFLINLTGLSTGLACALFIFLWVNDEKRVDKFNEHDARLYQVFQNYEFPHGVDTWERTPLLLAGALEEDFPEVETAIPVGHKEDSPEGILLSDNNDVFSKGYFAPKNFFQVFSYGLIAGDENNIVKDKKSIALSESLAIKLFNTTSNLIGRTLKWDSQWWDDELEITGVFKDPPANASEQFDFIMSIDHLWTNEHAIKWNGDYVSTYVLLKEGTDVVQFNQRVAEFMKSKTDTREDASLFVQRFSDRYLNGNFENGKIAGGRIAYVRMFTIIALFIILIACINFMTLSTAQASTKMKEVGVKKVVGARRSSLIAQFLGESVLMVLISFVVALIIVTTLLPQFNALTNKSLQLSFDASKLIPLGSLVLLTGLFAGSYSAFFLSGFKPISILKANLKSNLTGQGFRKGLVVFQFALSMIFIVGVVVVNQQMKFIQTKNLGYSRDNVLSFDRPDFRERSAAFLDAVKNVPGVVSASGMFEDVLYGESTQSGYSWKGEDADRNYLFKSPIISYDLIETLGMELKQGRSFSRQFQNEREKIIINESALRKMGLENPIGTKVKYGHLGAEREIVGVVSDFHYGSIHHKIEPLIFRFTEQANNIVIKVEAGTEQNVITSIEKVFKSFHPSYPFSFSFLDADYQRLYESESRVAALSKYFSGLAILISCLGLFGLAMFTAERRKKEIGIRKVLGASVFGIVQLLSKDFTKTILLAILIAMPIGFFISRNWLTNFEYSIQLQWWYFVLPALLILSIAWLTVGAQTVRAAQLNPVDSIKSE